MIAHSPTPLPSVPRDYVYVSIQGSNAVEIKDAYDGSRPCGGECCKAPRGLVLNAEGNRLFVHNFLQNRHRA